MVLFQSKLARGSDSYMLVAIDTFSKKLTALLWRKRPGKAGFTMLLEPPNEASAKTCFGRCAPLTSGKQSVPLIESSRSLLVDGH